MGQCRPENSSSSCQHFWGGLQCHPTETVVVTLFVVFKHPCPCDFTHFIQVPEQPGVQHLGPVAAVESLNIRVLIRLARFDVVNHDIVVIAPVREYLTPELRAVVRAQHLWQAAFVLELFEHTHQARARQRCIDLNLQCLPVEVIQYIKGPEANTVIQGVTHKIR